MSGIAEEKSFAFAVRIVKLGRWLMDSKREHILSKQIIRSGTSIGANVAEAQHAQSNADFVSKINIALKEAYETRYWLHLLKETDYITEEQYFSVSEDLNEILRLLTSICKTATENFAAKSTKH